MNVASSSLMISLLATSSASIRGDAQAGVAEEFELKLFLEFFGVVHRDDVASGDLQDTIIGRGFSECGGEFG